MEIEQTITEGLFERLVELAAEHQDEDEVYYKQSMKGGAKKVGAGIATAIRQGRIRDRGWMTDKQEVTESAKHRPWF